MAWLATTDCYIAFNINNTKIGNMPNFFTPDLGANPDSPFARDENDKLARRDFWLGLSDQSMVLAMTQGIGAALTADQKRAHLVDLLRSHLIDQVCIQEILPPE